MTALPVNEGLVSCDDAFRNGLANSDIRELEQFSAAESHIYESQQHSPSFGGTCTKDDAKLLGLHSLYYLCRMFAICPLASLFSGYCQNSPTTVANDPANASIVAQHALQHCRLIGEYIATSPDLSKITPLTAFASYLATPVVVALIKFTGLSGHRRKSARSEFRQSLVQISRYIQDTSHILNTLQMIWQPLAPMAQDLHHRAQGLSDLPGNSDLSTSLEGPDHTELVHSGVNSPVRDQDRMTLTYIETPDNATPEPYTHSRLARIEDTAAPTLRVGLNNDRVARK
ncbi:hypothetical protein IWW34DRAFT_898849 [Fusarium oxysporum f. sp. albedinis]|nr:hypothetical protein IWW34DRAFT_898849 [Fusarium oxysporum f. sp. albedinis]